MTEEEFNSLQPGDIVHSDTQNETFNFEFIECEKDRAHFKVLTLDGLIYESQSTWTLAKGTAKSKYEIIRKVSPDDHFLQSLYQ